MNGDITLEASSQCQRRHSATTPLFHFHDNYISTRLATPK